MKRISVPLVALALLALAFATACGSHHTPAKQAPQLASRQFCSGLTDTCIRVTIKRGAALQSARGRIPDVSSYQGHPNWALAKAAGIAGAIFKAGEFTTDPDAAFNNAQLRALHLWRAFYWFVRNTGCSHEAGQIIAAAHAYGISVVVNDLERPEAAGYGACLVPAERRAGLTPVDYTAPGTFPGGGFGLAPLLQAEYGPVLHPFWRPVVAWQCTDGHFGCVTFVPGIGVDDVSLDLGITQLHPVHPVVSRVHCYGPRAQLRTAKCKRIRPLVSRWSQARDATLRALVRTRCAPAAPRPHTALILRRYLRRVPTKPHRCAILRQRAGWFEDRVAANLY